MWIDHQCVKHLNLSSTGLAEQLISSHHTNRPMYKQRDKSSVSILREIIVAVAIVTKTNAPVDTIMIKEVLKTSDFMFRF